MFTYFWRYIRSKLGFAKEVNFRLGVYGLSIEGGKYTGE